MAKFKMEVEGLENYIAKISSLDGDVKAAVTKGLENSKSRSHGELHAAMGSHHRTGRTEGSLDDGGGVQWAGTMGTIDVGFHIHSGGLASIFLMYGTPRMKKDTKLYNAVYGAAAQAKVAEIQESALQEAIRKLGG